MQSKVDIIEKLEDSLKKDQIVARDWHEDGVSIDADIEDAIEEIKRLRKLILDANNYLSGGGCGARSVQEASELFKKL